MTILEKWEATGLLDDIDESIRHIVAFMLENQERSHINYTEIASKIFDVQPLPGPTGLIYCLHQIEEKDYFMEGLQG